MDMYTLILEIVQVVCWGMGIISGYFFYRVLNGMIVKRDGKVFNFLVFFSCLIINSMTIFPNDMFNVTLDLIWFIFLVLICFKGKLAAKFSTVAVLYPLIIANNFLVMDVLGFVYRQTGELFIMDVMCNFLEALIRIGIWYAIYKIFMDRISLSGKVFDERTWILLGTICLASLVCIITFIYYGPGDTYKIWLGALSCMVTNIGSLYLAGYFVNSIQQGIEQKNLKLQWDYYKELEKNQTEIRKYRHDINHHFTVMKDLFESGDREAAKTYFQEAKKQIAACNRMFCKNGIVNAVLNAKYNLAVSEEIDVFFHIDLPEVIAIDAVSLCTIFANTLDHAIEACVKIEEADRRKLSVKARIIDNGYFSYEIENSKVNEIKERRGKILTDKEEKGIHGLGLLNVKEIVERYEGVMDVAYTKESFRVVVGFRT